MVEAARAIRELIAYDELEPREIADLMISLESALTWLSADKAPTRSEDYFTFELLLRDEVSETRRTALDLLAYSLINVGMAAETAPERA